MESPHSMRGPTPEASGHTAGPWKTIPSPHGRGYRCVQLGQDDMYTTLELLPADAQLIAAAPDLLSALQLFVKQWEACGPNSDYGRYFKNVRDTAVYAIAKAVQP